MYKKALLIMMDKSLIHLARSVLRRMGFHVDVSEIYVTGMQTLANDHYPLVILENFGPWQRATAAIQPIRWITEGAIVSLLNGGTENDRLHCLGLTDGCLYLPTTEESLRCCIKGAMKKRNAALMDNVKRHFYQCRGLFIFPLYQKVYYGRKEIELTKTEYNLLNYLVRYRDMPLAKEQIVADVWRHDYVNDTEQILRSHISRLRTKIEEATNQMFIETVHGVGYRFITVLPENDKATEKTEINETGEPQNNEHPTG